jgi:hypothetical protein
VPTAKTTIWLVPAATGPETERSPMIVSPVAMLAAAEKHHEKSEPLVLIVDNKGRSQRRLSISISKATT